jgi:hypothetical protein
MRMAGGTILIVATALLAGCSEPRSMSPGSWNGEPPPLPADAPEVNCVVWGHGHEYRGPFAPFEEAEAVAVARCTEVRQYATVRRGLWEFVWYLVACDVIRVERGAWPHDRLVFCCYDAWPTPESGIMLGKGPFPFAEGRVVALALETQADPPRVVGQERRSRLAPHGEPRYMDTATEEGRRLHERVWAVVQDFAEQKGWPKAIGGSDFEVTDGAYVAEVVFRQTEGQYERRAVAVDKETLAVREVP